MGGKTVESGVLKEYIKRVYQLEALQYEQKALCKKNCTKYPDAARSTW